MSRIHFYAGCLVLFAAVSCADGGERGPKPRPDFGNRSLELRAYNAVLIAEREPVDVVLAGDSIFAWIRLPDLWPDTLVVNRAFGGDDSENLRQRFTADVVALHPTSVVVSTGTNDFWWTPEPGHPLPVPEVIERLVRNIREIGLAARQHGIRLYVCSLLPVNPTLSWGAQRAEWIPMDAHARANEALARLCNEEGIPFINVYPLLVDEQGYFSIQLTSDGVHPNVAGQAILVGQIRAALAATVPGQPAAE